MATNTCVWRGREDGCDDRGEGCAFFDFDDKKECKAAELCDWTAYVDGVKTKKKACVDECVGRTRKSGKRCRKDKACEWKIESKECVRKANYFS